ncbi:hypothetical protein DY000_02000106 [Brassica cretica]|uniref:Aminotransferase class I/classII domain-containing protein n=1 Tax=Brassica cretica TaxID=69181 RepID=A0ABQ7CG13_BRACR|nr:hypothetical protein DY000_02000106 [Brassica cretica]
MKKAVVNRETARANVFFLFVKEQGGDENSNTERDGTKVEIHTSDEISDSDCGYDIGEETDVGVLDVSSAFDDKFEGSSCWIGSISKGIVFGVPSTFGGTKSLVKFIIALPKK